MTVLIEHPEVVEEYRQKAVQRVREAYGWGHVAERYIELFAKLRTSR